MPLKALSAGTSFTLRGVTPVAAHCSVLEPKRLPHTQTDCHTHTAAHYNITDLLYTHGSHGWFSGEAGLEIAQDFLHTLTEHKQNIVLLNGLITVNVQNGHKA